MRDAREIGDSLVTRGVKLSLGGQVYDPSDPVGKMFFNILPTFAEFDLLRMRTREGMAIAKAKGKLRGKRPKLTARQQAHLVELHEAGKHTVVGLAELFKVSRPTVYRVLERRQTTDTGLTVARNQTKIDTEAAPDGIYAARYLADPAYRRKISRQPNKGESLHALKRDLLYAHVGTVRARHLEQQTEQAWCLTLVTNAVVDDRVLRPGRGVDARGRAAHRHRGPGPHLPGAQREHQLLRPSTSTSRASWPSSAPTGYRPLRVRDTLF